MNGKSSQYAVAETLMYEVTQWGEWEGGQAKRVPLKNEFSQGRNEQHPKVIAIPIKLSD